ncbi:MAG: hypothetical protein JSV79_07755 [Armatimonadota bacterium]|nr:MAG: hypothetical protein JSV79_07755 [Armatimonadota bacterium]
MSKQDDDRLTELLKAARPAPNEGWRERALAAMAAARRDRGGRHLGWMPTAAGTVLVAAALAFVPYSATAPSGMMAGALAAQQAAAAEVLEELERPGGGEKPARRETLPEHLRPYAERAAAFVRERHPDDPEMLMAAGMLTRGTEEALALLKEAAERSSGGATWAAYAGLMLETGPPYARPANWGVDPGDAEALAETKQEIAEAGLPDKLSPDDVAPVMEVLRRWQEVEPENGMPVALEVRYLYGLHRDSDALLRWEEASSLPEVTAHVQETSWAAGRLLSEMKMPWWDAASAAYSVPTGLGSMAWLREGARIGLYEGRLAQLEGRAEEAVRCWQATIDIGRHMQDSAGTLIECLVGIAVEGIGASPVWVWQHDGVTGIPNGPLVGGRLFHGRAHDFFVAHVGEAAADDLRDSLLRAKVRSMLSRSYVQGLGAFPDEQTRSLLLRALSILSASLLVAFLVVFGAISLRARKQADEATRLRRRGGLALAGLSLLPALGVGVVSWVGVSAAARFQPVWGAVFFGGLALSLVAMILVPLIVARWSRQPGARLVTAWRANLRRVLPVAIVLCAVFSLGLGLAGRHSAAAWPRRWRTESEMERVLAEIGPEWFEPKIPEDAWRAEPAPRVER